MSRVKTLSNADRRELVEATFQFWTTPPSERRKHLLLQCPLTRQGVRWIGVANDFVVFTSLAWLVRLLVLHTPRFARFHTPRLLRLRAHYRTRRSLCGRCGYAVKGILRCPSAAR